MLSKLHYQWCTSQRSNLQWSWSVSWQVRAPELHASAVSDAGSATHFQGTPVLTSSLVTHKSCSPVFLL